MSGSIVRFPTALNCIWILAGNDDPWTVVVGSYGWIYGSHHEAWKDARWLSRNYGLPI
jgi:hypothetical protein